MELERLIDMKAVDKKKAGPQMSRGEMVLGLWFWWAELHLVFVKLAEAAVGSVGLSYPRFSILFVLKFSVNPVRIVDLADQVHRTPNSVSMIVDRMVKQGLVKRVRSTRDRRAVIVKLTDHGNRVITQAVPACAEVVSARYSVFSDSEIALFSRIREKFDEQISGKIKQMSDETQIEKLVKGVDLQKIADSIGLPHDHP